ncbi:hypothetical protein [Paraburkholderia diazotrophica]|uniref:Response regulatory domain-containing protein n=1 Tax=Paraburkholderia diazotrophica TaxID=667676 RepID=A0A1H6X0X6_9BURK|nr:hypothetical protein [Paraburkholderia diazotrophica]SEJ18412.1 hypothetical protein SAMN05192539_1007188 [Paraburkholderia diazotrophica]
MEAKREIMDSFDNPGNNAKAQFDEAVRRLEEADARVRALSANPFADETTKRTALHAYEEARLLWLSCEAVLRSAAIVENPTQHAGKSIAIVHANSHVGESIALLLRLRGFKTTVLPTERLSDAASHGPATAFLVDVERKLDEASLLAIGQLKTDPSIRIIAMVPEGLEHGEYIGFDTVLVKPASIDTIVQAILFEI